MNLDSGLEFDGEEATNEILEKVAETGKLENRSSGFQELSFALQLRQAGLYFLPMKYSGM